VSIEEISSIKLIHEFNSTIKIISFNWYTQYEKAYTKNISKYVQKVDELIGHLQKMNYFRWDIKYLEEIIIYEAIIKIIYDKMWYIYNRIH
jgi:nitrate/nitrite-specific signal transduction histidine kinase